MAISGNPSWSNYSVSVSFRSADDDGVGVIARYVDAQNYYRFAVDRQRNFARLTLRHNGVTALLKAATFTYEVDVWYRLTLNLQGNTVSASVCKLSNCNGTVVTVATTDSALDHGAVGLYSWGSNGVRFDDISVALLP